MSLRFSAPPASSIVAGAPFNVTVELQGENAVLLRSATNPVTLAATGGATLTGTLTVPAVAGVARFTGLTVINAGAGFRLTAKVGAVGTTSDAFEVKPGPPSTIRSSTTPAAGNIAMNTATSIKLTFRDEFANPIKSTPLSVSTTLASATLTPSSGTTNSAGEFTTTLNAIGPGSAPITAILGGTVFAFPTPFTVVDPCPPSTMTFPGPVTGTVSSTSCALGTFAGAAYRFSLLNVGAASFQIASGFTPRIEITADPPVDNITVTPLQSPATTEWLLPAGTYQFRVAATAGSGAFTATGSNAAGNSGCVTRYLVVSGSFASQALGANDCVLTDVDDSFYDRFMIQSSRPCTITMRGLGAPALDAFLYVLDGVTGDYLDYDDQSGGANDAQITRTSCTSPSGPLMIYANVAPPPGPQTGSYSLTIQFTNAPAIRTSLQRGMVPLPGPPPKVKQR